MLTVFMVRIYAYYVAAFGFVCIFVDNRINDNWSCENPETLKTMLKGYFNFSGFIVRSLIVYTIHISPPTVCTIPLYTQAPLSQAARSAHLRFVCIALRHRCHIIDHHRVALSVCAHS